MNWKRFFIILLFIFFDLVVYIFLGLILLGYEDLYDPKKGEYWSLKSMTFGQKTAYIGWYIWYAINVILVIYLLIKLFKKLKKEMF